MHERTINRVALVWVLQTLTEAEAGHKEHNTIT